MDNAKTVRKRKMGQKARNSVVNGTIYVLLAVLGIVWVLPIVFLIYTAFRVTPNTGIINKLFPDDLKLGFDNFYILFTETQFGLWLRNTIIVAACSCLITTLFILMVSYAFSRMRFKMRKPLMNVMLILNMFPGFMSMIAIYFILKAMGLTNTLTALVMVYSGSAGMGYYICKGFFDTIPRSLEEAAKLDGASQWTIFWKMTLPLSKPIIIYTVLTSFMGPWCDFIFAKLIINNTSPELFTVAIGLYNLINADKGSFNTWFTVFCAGSVIVGTIITILFLSMQKYYVAGVSQGAVK